MFHNYVILRVMAHEMLLLTHPQCTSVTLVTLRVVFIPYINCLFIVARLTLHFVRYITADESVTIYDKLHVTPRITLHISRFKALRVTLSQLMSRLMRHVIFCISKMFDHFITFRKKNADLIADALKFMYTPWPDNSDKYALRSQLVDSIGDSAFVAPSHEVADIHSQYAEVFMYEFAHRSKNGSYYAEWMGVAHGENLPFDFGIPMLPNFPEYDEADRNISFFVMALYANFANFGNPTPQPVSGVMWDKYNSSRRAYLRVNTKPKMAASFAPRRMSFWNNYHPKLKKTNFDLKRAVVGGVSSNVVLATYLQLGVIICATIV